MKNIVTFNTYDMKHIYGLLMLLLVATGVKGQYVALADSNFKYWFINHGHAECISGNQLDITCPGLDSIITLDCSNYYLANINEVQYMHNLKKLDCSENQIAGISAFPASLKHLVCDGNALISLSNLPSGLDSLSIAGCALSSLPVLPDSLKRLLAQYNNFTSVGNLPPNLTWLTLDYNQITSLPALPLSMLILAVDHNKLTALPTLPQGIYAVGCSYNLLTSLPAFPSSLTSINCDHNAITALPVLGDSLNSLWCGYNLISSFPPLPAMLNDFECDSLPISALPPLPHGLFQLECMYDNLTSLPATTPGKLFTLNCSYNQLTSITPVDTVSLQLNCSHNLFTTLSFKNGGGITGGSNGQVYPSLDCSYNQITDLILSITTISEMTNAPAPAQLDDLNCSNNPNLKCLPYLPIMASFEFDSTQLACLPNYPQTSYSSPPVSSLPLCVNGNPGGCPHYSFYVDAGPPAVATCYNNQVYLNATVYSGYPPYIYHWFPTTGLSSPNIAAPTVLPTASTLYYLTVTDSLGAQTTDSIWVRIDTPVVAAANVTISGCTGPVTGSICIATVGGVPPYSYLYYNNDSLYTACRTGLDSGLYVIAIGDSFNCGTYLSVSIAPLRVDSFIMAYNCGGGSGNATVVVTGGTTPITYLWSDTHTSFTDSALTAGTYTVTVTDGGGCSATAAVTVAPPAASTLAFDSVTMENAYCYGYPGTSCAYVSGGAQPYQYAWSSGLTGMSCDNGLMAGSYGLTVTDSLGCTISYNSIIITQPSPVRDTIVVTYPGCSTTGQACVLPSGGTPPYQYFHWSNGEWSSCDTALVAGVYNVSVYDQHSCANYDATVVTAAHGLFIDSFLVTDVACFGGLTGSVCPVVSGGEGTLNYMWSPGAQMLSCITNTQAGNYTVTVSDANNCTATGSATINQPVALLNIDNLTGFDACGTTPGYACASVSGGTTPYSYLWPDAQVTMCDSSLMPGTYDVTVEDSHACSATGSITIGSNIPITLMVAAPDSNATPDSVTFTVSGTSANYYINWGDGQNTGPVANDSSAEHTYQNSGVYTAFITDSNGCTTNYVVDAGCTGQCVWPGDANYDGLVDNLDLLSIGLAYDSTGYTRYNPTINFIPQYCQNWIDTLPGAVNYKHADCNGDGTINADDTLAIMLNYSLTHPRGHTDAPSGTPVNLYPVIAQDTVYNGDTLHLQVVLGNGNMPASHVYGVAFTLHYDPTVVDTSGVNISFANSWIGNANERINIAKNITTGSLECAVTRINHLTKSGQGPIGSATFLITTDNLNGKDYSYFIPRFYITDVTLIDSAGNLLPVNGGYDSTIIAYLPTDVKPIKPVKNIIGLFPNPAASQVMVTSNNLPITGIKVIDVLGNEVKQYISVSGTVTTQFIDLGTLAVGVYTVEVQTTGGISIQKLVVAR